MIIKSNPQPSKTPYSQLLSLIILAAALTLLLAGCGAPIETTPEPTNVNVQLKWLHQAQFAGFYVAQAQGLYAQEGLAVNFLEGGPGIEIAERVLSGEADFGVIAPEKLLQARDQGKPLVAVGVTYRRNPFVLVSLPESGIQHPQDLLGKTVAVGGLDGEIQLSAMMYKLGLDLDQVEIVSWGPDLSPFWEGEIDVTPAFAAGSLIPILEKEPDVNLIWPIDYGIHFYSDTIITSEAMIESQPDVVLGFLKASLAGHRFVVENPQEAVDLSLPFIPGAEAREQALMVESSLPMIHTGLGPIGWMDAQEWGHMHDTLLLENIINNSLDLETVYNPQFLEAIYGEQP